MNLKLIVIGIDQEGMDFRNKITTLLFDYLAQQNPGAHVQVLQAKIMEIYQESVRQVFDCMNPDFQDFCLNILHFPQYEKFLNSTALFSNPIIANTFKEYFKEFALGIFFAIQNQGLLFYNGSYILDNPGLDHITCMLYFDN